LPISRGGRRPRRGGPDGRGRRPRGRRARRRPPGSRRSRGGRAPRRRPRRPASAPASRAARRARRRGARCSAVRPPAGPAARARGRSSRALQPSSVWIYSKSWRRCPRTPGHGWDDGRVETPAELFDLTGKVAVVTGGSRGIGRAVAGGLAAAGADVVIASRKYDNCVRAADEITAATGRRALPVACHVGRWEDAEALVDAVYGEL